MNNIFSEHGIRRNLLKTATEEIADEFLIWLNDTYNVIIVPFGSHMYKETDDDEKVDLYLADPTMAFDCLLEEFWKSADNIKNKFVNLFTTGMGEFLKDRNINPGDDLYYYGFYLFDDPQLLRQRRYGVYCWLEVFVDPKFDPNPEG